jgi:hypothetical protein
VTGPHEQSARTGAGPGFTDAVTFSFGDPAAQLYGLARIGLSPAEDGVLGSALAVLFAGRDPVAALARGGLDLGAEAGWESVAVDGLSTRVVEPLRRWTVALEGESHGFELTFEAVSEPAEVGGAVAGAGGMEG